MNILKTKTIYYKKLKLGITNKEMCCLLFVLVQPNIKYVRQDLCLLQSF